MCDDGIVNGEGIKHATRVTIASTI
jgi:hypothetical protein